MAKELAPGTGYGTTINNHKGIFFITAPAELGEQAALEFRRVIHSTVNDPDCSAIVVDVGESTNISHTAIAAMIGGFVMASTFDKAFVVDNAGSQGLNNDEVFYETSSDLSFFYVLPPIFYRGNGSHS